MYATARSAKALHSLGRIPTSKHPKCRYLCDTLSRVQTAAVSMTPTAVNDAILSAATTSKKRNSA